MGGKTAEKIIEVPSLDPIASVREEVLLKSNLRKTMILTRQI